jgi:hypothetical protein
MVSHAKSGMMERMSHFWCGLRGHDTLLQFRRNRMFLECMSCGHQSPGWDLSEPKPSEAEPAMTLQTETPVRSIMRPRLINARRVA